MSLLQLRDRQTTPSRGWDYQVQGGPLIAKNTFGDLVRAVFEYHVEHGLPTVNLAEIVEDEICRRKPVKCAPPRPIPDGERSMSVGDVWRFLVTMKEWVKNGSFVEQAEAERRAEICAGCRFNGDVTDGSCWGCTNIMGLIEQIIGTRGTRLDHALRNCKVCGCLNKVQAWVPLDVLRRAGGDLEYPADTGSGVPCWKRKSES